MPDRLRLLLVSVALVSLAACGLSRYIAERNYVGQMLYDYTYAKPLEEVWPAAMSVQQEGPDAGREESWGRSHRSYGVEDAGYGDLGGHVMAVRLGDGGTRLLVLTQIPDGGPTEPAIFGSRNFDRELKIMRILAPGDAERFYTGSLQAGRRAEQQ